MKKHIPLFVATLATLFITLTASAQGGKDRTAVVSLKEEYDIVIDHAYNRDCPYYGLSSHYFDGEHLVAEEIKWTSQQYLK